MDLNQRYQITRKHQDEYRCDSCSKKFQKANSLHKHRLREHRDKPPLRRGRPRNWHPQPFVEPFNIWEESSSNIPSPDILTPDRHQVPNERLRSRSRDISCSSESSHGSMGWTTAASKATPRAFHGVLVTEPEVETARYYSKMPLEKEMDLTFSSPVAFLSGQMC